ncbi:thiamine phosphate synthase [Flavobacterium sp. FPG59]|jgi:thiamine-phosphate pyrophosphorylase|uniref:thiamine phosphate synthase n=1 Tax=Flavobacterium sp. FPG59 TaxID=1929267 RepID=UPI000A389E4F|nr:thiamine phosphate synthase [Flavobacterium sp. FPG59]OUD36548.1 thiamine-phosphate diphosphorylase [Flavobacterium sp. FPG59]
MYHKLQYITQGNTVEEQLSNIRKALDNGCEWIQLRFKNASTSELFDVAETAKILCDVFSAYLIINDNLHLAQQLDADGVHVGLTDMNVAAARTILGREKIIGATANTFEDIQNHIENGCNYIGLGPFQFTATKEKLSPILGVEGYHSIIEKMKAKEIQIPIYAIGGIQLTNVESIMETGVHGIAVSGLITQSENPSELITQLNEKLYVTI